LIRGWHTVAVGDLDRMQRGDMMRRIWLAIRIFFLTLFSAAVAEQAGEVLEQRKQRLSAQQEKQGAKPPVKAEQQPPKPKQPPAPRQAARSEAVTLLAALQREARFVDFVKEPLGGYSDAQIGAAARDVHRDCGKLLDRLFALQPVLAEAEDAEVEVPAGFDASRYRLTGNVTGNPPFRGRLVHPGWQATICELPTWSGNPAAARIVAPVEVELK
jgi:hypothetical protein